MNTTKEIKLDLQQRYKRGNSYRLSDLLEVFHTYKQGSSTIDENHTKLKIIWDEILMLKLVHVCTCNPEPACTCEVLKKVRGNVGVQQVMKFVTWLNDSFELVRSLVLMTVLLPNMNAIFNMATNHKGNKVVVLSLLKLFMSKKKVYNR